MLNSLLRIVHKYPLLEEDYSELDELSPLYRQVVAAAEKYLGPYFRVSAILHDVKHTDTIPNCRYTA